MPSRAFMRCTNHSKRKNKSHGITFHSRESWLKAVKPTNPRAAKLSVCQLHFAPWEVYFDKRHNRVLYDAVPSLHLLPSDDEDDEMTELQQLDNGDELKTESEDGVLVDLFTKEETVIQNRLSVDSGIQNGVPIKEEILEESDMCEDAQSELQPSYRNDARQQLDNGDELKTESEDGVLVDLFTKEETVIQNLLSVDSGIQNGVPIKEEILEESDMCEDAQSELQPSYRNDAGFARPMQIKYENEAVANEVLENSEELPENAEAIPENAEAIPEGLEEITENSEKIPEDSEKHPENSKRVLENPDEEGLYLLIKLSKAYLSPELANFVEVQTLLKRKLQAANKSKRYSKEMLFFALKLYQSYPQTYRLMQESFSLPSIVKIKLLCRNLTWELNDSWTRVLRARFDWATAAERECVMCVAKVRISLGLSYDPVCDRMAGLYEKNGEQKPCVARYATVVYARGIFSSWRQPISYVVLPATTRHNELCKWLDDVLSKLLDIGLNVRAVITDFDASYSLTMRPLSFGKTYFPLKDKHIYCFYDCTQLMVKLRDSLMMHNISFKGMIAEWDIILELFDYESTRKYKFGTGLTEEHVNPSPVSAQQAKIAIETLSPKVASALAAAVDMRVLDDSAHGTIQLLIAFSTLYDVLHNKELAVSGSGITPPLKFLLEMLRQFEKIHFFGKEDRKVHLDPGVMNGFNNNVRAAIALQERMRQAGYNALPMRAFNNDPIGLFSSRLRTYEGNKDPTAKQLIDGFRKAFVCNILKSFSKEDRLDGFLKSASGIKDVDMQLEKREIFKGLVKASQAAHLNRVETSMIAKCLLTQCIRFKYCCAGGAQFCKKPSAAFNEYLNTLERNFRLYFAADFLNGGIIARILASVNDDEFPAPCSCFPILYLKTLYLRFRVDNLAGYNNLKFKKSISRDLTMNVNINFSS